MLIGRDHERSLLQSAAARAREGQGSLMLLAGEAGVGKTVLARAALDEAGLPIRRGAGLQGGAPAYWPLTAAVPELAKAADCSCERSWSRPISTPRRQ